MPREIPTSPLCSPVDGVLFSRKQLLRRMRTKGLEQQAKQHARRILRDAQQEAELIRQHAYQEGYQQGMLDALQQTASYLAASQTLDGRCRERLSQHVRAMLSSAVDHPETLLLVLDEWLRNLPASDETLYLTLPSTAHALQPRLREVLAANWKGKIQLDYHAGPDFVMRHADQLAEFSPAQYVESATRALLQTLDSLPQDCRRISDFALQEFIEQWQHRSHDVAS